MNRFWLFNNILFLIAVIVASKDVGLRTQQGMIYGRQTQYSTEYLGIQYAKVVRWKPPIDLALEKFPNGSLHATSFGPCCPQITTRTPMTEPNEQCLYLNIYKPIILSNHPLLPVAVWIHGGAHSLGCSSRGLPVTYNGTNMIAHSPPGRPVIIITINYRLGVLTNMYLKELVEENPEWPTAANYNYLDMLSALRWIKKNIEDYGGDPARVSLIGQSAGGLSAIDLGAVKGSAGLYHTVISESALKPPSTSSSYYNVSDALAYSNSIVQRVKCANKTKEKLLACLRSTPIKDLVKAYGDRYTKPIIDKHFFPLYPLLAIQRGTYHSVPLIMGYNDHEYAMCLDHPKMNSAKAKNIIIGLVEPKRESTVVDHYHLKNCSSDPNAKTNRCCNVIRLILNDGTFDCDIRRLFNTLYSKYGPEYAQNNLFAYHLDCNPRCCSPSKRSVCQHASEIPYVFGIVTDMSSRRAKNCTWDTQAREFSNGIISHWMNVVVTGRPLNDWPSYNPSSPKRFFITPGQEFLSENWDRDCSFLMKSKQRSTRNIWKLARSCAKDTLVFFHAWMRDY